MRFVKSLLIVAFAAMLAVFAANAFLARESLLGEGSDFALGWRAAGNYFAGEPLYSVARDGMRPYKYPPWTTALYFPLAPLPLEVAGLLWRLLVVASLLASATWVASRARAGWAAAAGAAIPFWGFWNLNLLAGQPNVVWMAIALWAFDRLRSRPVLGWTLLLGVLSGKWFQLVSLAGVPREVFRGLRPRLLIGIAAAFLAVSLPVLWQAGGVAPFVEAYREAATGGRGALGGSSYGFPMLFVDLFGLSRDDSLPRVIFFLPSAALAWLAYRALARRGVSEAEGFAAALGLGAAIHPMAYSYTFIFAYPLAACALAAAFSVRENRRIALSIMGVIAIAGLNEKTAGPVGVFLESHQIKAIGTFLLALSYLPGVKSESHAKR